MFSMGHFFEILLIFALHESTDNRRKKKKIHNDDLEDGYNVVISAKRNMYRNIYVLLTIVIQNIYRDTYK